MQVLNSNSTCNPVQVAIAEVSHVCVLRMKDHIIIIYHHALAPSWSTFGKERKQNWTMFGSCQREVWDQWDSRQWLSDQIPKLPPYSSVPLLSGRGILCCRNGPPRNAEAEKPDTGSSSRAHRPPGQRTNSVMSGVALTTVIKIVSSLRTGSQSLLTGFSMPGTRSSSVKMYL